MVNLKARLMATIERVPASWRAELKSALCTFLAAFLLEVGSHLGDISVGSLSRDVVLGVLTAAIRSGIKALLSWEASKLK
jgi:hypothetical protein